MTTVFEYKNSRLSVVEGAPEKPRDDLKDTPENRAQRNNYAYKLLDCRRIPVADEDQAKVIEMILNVEMYNPKNRGKTGFDILKEGELYHVDVDLMIGDRPVNRCKACNDQGLYHCARPEECGEIKTEPVARIKQPDGPRSTVLGQGYHIKKKMPTDQFEDTLQKSMKAHGMLEPLPSLNAEQEKKEGMSKYSNSEIGSHHWAATLLSFIMRVGEYLETHENNPSETIHYREWGTHMKQRAVEVNNYLQSLPDKPDSKPVVASTEDQEEIMVDLIREFFGVPNPPDVPFAILQRIKSKFTITRNPKQP